MKDASKVFGAAYSATLRAIGENEGFGGNNVAYSGEDWDEKPDNREMTHDGAKAGLSAMGFCGAELARHGVLISSKEDGGARACPH